MPMTGFETKCPRAELLVLACKIPLKSHFAQNDGKRLSDQLFVIDNENS
jgi:hypothetical protein